MVKNKGITAFRLKYTIINTCNIPATCSTDKVCTSVWIILFQAYFYALEWNTWFYIIYIMFTSLVSIFYISCFKKDVSTAIFKAFTPMLNASHRLLHYSLYINLSNVILLKLGFVFVIVYEPPWDDTRKRKLPSA